MSVIPVIVRALGIGLAAAVAYLLLTLTDDGEGGANIGAGLAVFAVLAVGSFLWALLDGVDRRGSRATRAGLGEVVLRWVAVSVLAVAIIVVTLVARSGAERLDIDTSSTLFLWLLALGPALVGALIGYSARAPEVSRTRKS
jgi:hypothetical protein